MTVNTHGVCSECGGRLRNATGRRHTVARLIEIHNETCPGLNRKDKPK